MSEKLKSNLGLLVRKVPRHRFARALGAMLSSPVRNRAVHTPMPKTRHEFADVSDAVVTRIDAALHEIMSSEESFTMEEFSTKLQHKRKSLGTSIKADPLNEGIYFTEDVHKKVINFLNTLERTVEEMIKGFPGYEIYNIQVWTNPIGSGAHDGVAGRHTDKASLCNETVVLTGTLIGPSTSYYATQDSPRIETPDQSLCGHVAGRRGALHSSPLYNKRKRNTVVVKLIKIK